jgi:phosphoglycerol transferase MdoB-like AlkP superfamily enzyme
MEFAPPPPDFVEGPFVLVVSLMLSGFSTVATVLYVVVTAILYRALRARPKTYTVSDIILFCVLALLLIYLATHVEYVPLQRNA